MAFVAGEKIRASKLNAGQPLMAYVASDVSVISTTSMVNITGLVVPLEANALYAWDAYLGYVANETGDITTPSARWPRRRTSSTRAGS